MTERKTAKGIDFEVLRRAIEGSDPDSMLGYYADDARARVLNGDAPPFELRGKAEISRYLRTVFGRPTTHRVQYEVVGQNRMTFQDTCEYPDGARVVVETTLEVRDGKIVRQVDVVAQGARADREAEIGQRPPARKSQPRTRPGADATPTDRLPRFEQATEKEDFG